MSQDDVRTVQDTHGAAAHGKRSRAHYAALVDKYFEYAHSNRLEEVVAMFTDDALATFVVAPEPFYGKDAIRGFYVQLFQDFPHIEPEILAVVIEDNRAITEQRMTIVSPTAPAWLCPSTRITSNSRAISSRPCA
jgi:hypothetical protein